MVNNTKLFVRTQEDPYTWIEKKEVSLGSARKPNHNILRVLLADEQPRAIKFLFD